MFQRKKNYYYQTKNKTKAQISKKGKKINSFIFFVLLGVLIITFFTRNNYKNVKNPDSQLFKEPIQEKVIDSMPIEFQKDGYEFILTPLYEYEISALVVNRFDYTRFSLQRTDSVFPLDLCVIWGDNVKNGVYKDKSLTFRQDARFCWGMWGRDLNFNWGEVSNNHLVIKDELLKKKAFSISEGDQVYIKGKLVNVEAENIDGNLGDYESQLSNWNSSVKRGDSGAGACEIIYVEELEILKKANPISFYAFKISFWLLIVFVFWRFLVFFYEMFRFNKKTR